MVVIAISNSVQSGLDKAQNLLNQYVPAAFQCGGIDELAPGTSYSHGNSDKSVGTWVTYSLLTIWLLVVLFFSNHTLCGRCCALARAASHRGMQTMYFSFFLSYFIFSFHHAIVPFVYTDYHTSWDLMFKHPIDNCNSFFGPTSFYVAMGLTAFAHYCMPKEFFDQRRDYDAWCCSKHTLYGLLYAAVIVLPAYFDDKLRSVCILADFGLFFLFTLYMYNEGWGSGRVFFSSTQLVGAILMAINHPGLSPSPALNWGAYGHLIWLGGFIIYPFLCYGGKKSTHAEYTEIPANP